MVNAPRQRPVQAKGCFLTTSRGGLSPPPPPAAHPPPATAPSHRPSSAPATPATGPRPEPAAETAPPRSAPPPRTPAGLPQQGVQRLPRQGRQIGQLVQPGGRRSASTIQAFRSFSSGLLGGEAPVFLRERRIQANAQAAQVAAHDRQQQRASSAGDMEHLPFAGHIAEDMPAGAAQPFGIGGAGHHQVDPHPQRAERSRKRRQQAIFSAGVSCGWRRITARSRSESARACPRAREPKTTTACTSGSAHSRARAGRRLGIQAPGPDPAATPAPGGLTPGDRRRREGRSRGWGRGGSHGIRLPPVLRPMQPRCCCVMFRIRCAPPSASTTTCWRQRGCWRGGDEAILPIPV